MKKTLLTIVVSSIIMLISVSTQAQKFSSLDKSPFDIAYFRADRNTTPMIKVIYSRPQLKERALSELAPNGKVWRTGANEATEIKFFQDMTFGGKTVKAGTYSLYTIPNDTEWTVILSNSLDVWGAYNYNESNDVLRVQAPVSSGDVVEAFSIAFEKNTMYLAWGTTRVAVSVSK